MKKLSDSQAIIGPVRLSYLSVFQSKTNDLKEGAKEYSAVLLFPKAPCEESPNIQEELAGLREMLKAAVFAKWGDKTPAKLRNPIRDGDVEPDAHGEPKAPGYWFMNVSAKEQYPPLLIDGMRNKAKPEDWFSGDWGKVQLSVFAYDQKGNRGVSAGLRAIQFVAKGESMGGGGAVSPDAFDEVKTPVSAGGGNAPDEFDPFADE